MAVFKKMATGKEAAREAKEAATNPNYVPPEYRHEFTTLCIELQGLLDLIVGVSDPRDEGRINDVVPPTVVTGARWTCLSEKGYFVPFTTVISEALARITAGLLHEENQDEIKEGLLRIRTAVDKAVEDLKQQGSPDP